MAAVTSISIAPQDINLYKNQRALLTVTVLPVDATNKNFAYTINNNNVSIENGTNIVTGVSEGLSVITVTSEDGSFTDHCTVYVSINSNLDEQSRQIVTNDDIITTTTFASPLLSSTTKFNVPYRGPSSIEEHINFFNEVVHDLIILGKYIDSNRNIQGNIISMKEYIYNNLAKALTGDNVTILSNTKEGMKLYRYRNNIASLLGTFNISNINSTSTNKASLTEKLEAIDAKIEDAVYDVKEASL